MRRVRIHKALADAGVASRRKAEQLVDQKVASTVNGSHRGVGQLVDPGRDALAVDGTRDRVGRSAGSTSLSPSPRA